jgi:TetR/AcrR family fatty acid metabolism transcriptional regulator
MAGRARTDRRSARAQRTEERQRATVLVAAALQFERHGFDQATMAAIARGAGVAVGSLYKLFPSKQALHAALLERHAAALLAHESAPPLGFPLEDLAEDLVPGGGDRRERSAEAKRGEILAAALRVFEAVGYYQAPMADIAVEAGMATGTLYNFFPSKEALFHTLVEQKTADFFAYLRREVDQTVGATAKLHRLVEAQCAFCAANRDFLRIYVTARSGFEWAAKQELGVAFRYQYAAYLDWVAGILAAGMAEGVLRDMEPLEMAQALVGMLNAVLFEWTVAQDSPPLAARAQRIVSLFLCGARVQPADIPM